MVIKGDQNQDVPDHKEQADLLAQFYESLAIPSNEEHFDNDHRIWFVHQIVVKIQFVFMVS
jgi:hypothetical protein